MNSPEEEASKNARDVLFASLKHACEFFEEGYMKQIEFIHKTIV